jgi:hypothetical protein
MTETPMHHNILLPQGTLLGSTEDRHAIADIQSLPFIPPHDSFLSRFSTNNVIVFHCQAVVYSMFGIYPIPFFFSIARLTVQELLLLSALPLLPMAAPPRMESTPYWLCLYWFGSCPSNGERSLSALPRVVTRTISDGRTDGRRMAAGASVTWTHCSVLFEVTWDKTLASMRIWCIRADAPQRPRGHGRPRRRTSLPSPPLPLSLPLSLPPSPAVLASVRTKKNKKIKKTIIIIIIF